MSRIDDASNRAFLAGCALIPYPAASELRIVVQCCTVGNQQRRLMKVLDEAIDRFLVNAEIDTKAVSE